MLSTLLHQTGVREVQSMYTHWSKESSVIYMLITSAIVGLRVTSRWCVGGSRTKSISLLWELNSIFMYILRKKICCIDHQHNTNMAALSRGCKPRIRLRKTRMWKELVCLWESGFKSKTAKQFVFLRIQVHCTYEQFNKSWKRKAKLERDASFFSPAPHTRRACEAPALRASLLFSPVNHFWEKNSDCFAV